jgi:hypothetical protein
MTKDKGGVGGNTFMYHGVAKSEDFQPLALSTVGHTLLPFYTKLRVTIVQLEFVTLSHTRAAASPCLNAP